MQNIVRDLHPHVLHARFTINLTHVSDRFLANVYLTLLCPRNRVSYDSNKNHGPFKTNSNTSATGKIADYIWSHMEMGVLVLHLLAPP